MRTRAALISAVLALAVVPATANAAITVANQNDSGPGSLRQAIADAPPGETIVLPAGTYTLTSGELMLEKAVTISGSGAGSTVIRAAGPFRVLRVGENVGATISELTVRDGAVVAGVAQGAGILNGGGDLVLGGVVVTNNIANANGAPGANGGVALGGGIFSEEGTLRLTDSSVLGNTATATGGSGKNGGVALGGGIYAEAPAIVNSTISGNNAGARGGPGPADPDQFGGVALGAGILAESGPGGTNLVGSAVNGNLADASGGPGAINGVALGAGVFSEVELSTLSAANSTVSSNVLKGESGGTFLGGGIFLEVKATGSAGFSNMTIAGNRIEVSGPATLSGGNLAVEAAAPQLLTIANSIVADGVGPAGSENCLPEMKLTSLGFNLDSLDQCGFKAPGDRVNTNPLLGPLQLNGGPTATMAPASNSPAIDQGSSFGLGTDQRGVVRPIDLPSIPNSAAPGANGADIGAFELQPSNAFALGKLKKNRKRGTATLTVHLPQPSAGILTLSGKGLKPQTKAVAGEATVTLKVVTKKGKVRKALRKRGKRKVGINVTYTPTGNAAATQSRKTKLVKKKRPKKKRQRR